MKRRNFFTTIAAAFAAKKATASFINSDLEHQLPHSVMGRMVGLTDVAKSKAEAPQPVPPFQVGQRLSNTYIFGRYWDGTEFKTIVGTTELVEDWGAPNDNWRHLRVSRSFVQVTTFDGWTIWAETVDPDRRCYVVTEVRRS